MVMTTTDRDVGLVYVFEYENGQWIEKSIITPPNQNSSQIFLYMIFLQERISLW